MDSVDYRTHVFTVSADAGVLDDHPTLSTCIDKLILAGGFTRLNQISHQFEPQGITTLTLLSESHIALHTWPEQGIAKFVVSTCQKQPTSPSKLADVIRHELSARSVTYEGVGA